MRIMFVLDEPDQANGPNIWLTRHLPALKQLGLSPELLVVNWRPERKCRYADALEQAGIPVTWVDMHGYTETAVSVMLSAIGENPPDVFVPNCNVLAHLAGRFLRDAGVITIGIMHSDDRYYHEIFDMFIAGPREWRVSGVVGVSDFLREMIEARAGWRVPFLKAACGAPVPAQTAQWRPDRFRAIYAGRLVEYQKRISRVAGHFVTAARAIPTFEGVLYGDGAERETALRMIEPARLGDRVRLGGVLLPEAMQPAMAEGQAFVLLSDFEGLSIALVEAMAAGLVPIVSRMRSGVTDVVRHGETGFVIDADDANAFVETCRVLSADRELWNRVSRAARAIVIDRGYTAEGCARAWAGFVRDLAPATPPARPIEIPAETDWDGSRLWRQPGDMIQILYQPTARTRVQQVSAEARPIFVWGAGAAGQNFVDSIAHLSLSLAGFLDSDVRKAGTTLGDLPISQPSTLDRVNGNGRATRPFVVVASQHAKDIAASLEARGFASYNDYVVA